MNQCDHHWEEVKHLSAYVATIRCKHCSIIKVVKPYVYINPYQYSLVANEYISYQLLRLLINKGVKIIIPDVKVVNLGVRYSSENCAYPYKHCMILMDYIGEHSRIVPNNEPADAIYPGWIYDFDRWIGRFDGNANLIKLSNNVVTTIDFNMTFCWACGIRPYIIRPDFMDVAYSNYIKQARDESFRHLIKSLSDDEIFNLLHGIDNELIPTQVILAYYTGLCLRRDLL